VQRRETITLLIMRVAIAGILAIVEGMESKGRRERVEFQGSDQWLLLLATETAGRREYGRGEGDCEERVGEREHRERCYYVQQIQTRNEISYVQTKWYRQTPERGMWSAILIQISAASVVSLVHITLSCPCPRAAQMCLSSPRLLSSAQGCQ
jgi:hypothetical protein